MSYETTTPNIGLPQWVYTDKPQMADFNTAFSKIDTTTGGKLDANNYAHLSTPLTTGTAEAFLLALDPPLTAYVPGMLLVVNFHAEFFPGALIGGEFCTLDVNGLGAKPIYFTNSSFAGSVSAGPHPVMYTDYGNGRWILLDQFLSVGGGQLKGSIYPSGELVRIGTSSNPFQDVYADTVHGSIGEFTSITPKSSGSLTIGTVSNPVSLFYFQTIRGVSGTFSNNVSVAGEAVWSNAEITSQPVTISGGTQASVYTIMLYKVGRLVIVTNGPSTEWMDFGNLEKNTQLGTLPSGFWPANNMSIPLIDPMNNATIRFMGDGRILANTEAVNQYCGYLCSTAYLTA